MHLLAAPSFGVDQLVALLTGLPVAAALASVRDAAASVGVDEDSLASAILEAQEAGDLTIWDPEGFGPHVSLTSLAATRLGLRLDDKSRWVPAAQVEGRDFIELEDRQAGQGESAIALEHAEVRPAYSADEDRAAWTIYGLRVQWPLPRMGTVLPVLDAPPEVCPGCGGKRLDHHECCVICTEVTTPALPEKAGRRRYVPGELRGGTT